MRRLRLQPRIPWEGNKTPDLLVYLDNDANRATLVDVVVTHPGSTSYLPRVGAVGGGGVMSLEKERMKRTKYDGISREQGYEFQPFAVETCGHFGPAAMSLIDRICRVASTLREKDYASFRSYWLGRLSVALQAFTAAGFLRTAYEVKARAIRQGNVVQWAPFVDDDEEEANEAAEQQHHEGGDW